MLAAPSLSLHQCLPKHAIGKCASRASPTVYFVFSLSIALMYYFRFSGIPLLPPLSLRVLANGLLRRSLPPLRYYARLCCFRFPFSSHPTLFVSVTVRVRAQLAPSLAPAASLLLPNLPPFAFSFSFNPPLPASLIARACERLTQ